MRPFRNLNFRVRPQNLAPARQVLAADGYAPSPPRTPRQEAAIRTTCREDAFRRDADVVELHWAFAPREFPLPLDLDDVCGRLETLPLGGTLVRTLSAEHLLLVLCAHGAKHCWERLGWICDVAELLRGTPALDLSGMLAQARSLGVERIVLLGLRLAAELLDVPLPEDVACRARDDRAVGALAAQVRGSPSPRRPSVGRRARLHSPIDSAPAPRGDWGQPCAIFRAAAPCNGYAGATGSCEIRDRSLMERVMPVTAVLSKQFYEKFGEDVTNELVNWFNAVDATYRAELRELNELNFARFDAKLGERLAESDARWERRLAEFDVTWERRIAELHTQLKAELSRGLHRLETKLLRWMFGLWVSTLIGLGALFLRS